MRILMWYRVRNVLHSLKPADWLTLVFLVATLPLAIYAQVWSGVAIRLVLVPAVILGRLYLNKEDTPINLLTRAITFALDLYPLVACIYMYGEDGTTLAFLYPDKEKMFWDDAIKQADANLLGINVETGAGAAVRARTSETFNRVVGEYLHFAYFAFYVVLVGTPLLSWVVLQREYFDRVMTAQTFVYLFCCGAYLFFPTAGPYWAYPDHRPEAESVGFIFSKITHALVGGGSSIGTAFPSGHCSITTSAMVVSAVYMPRLFVLYLFIGPALVVATVWGGFHYFYDALFGVFLGLVGAAVGIAFARVLRYTPPACDTHYSAAFRARSGRDFLGLFQGGTLGGESKTGSSVYYMNLPEFDEEEGDGEYAQASKASVDSLGNALSVIPALRRVPTQWRSSQLGPPA